MRVKIVFHRNREGIMERRVTIIAYGVKFEVLLDVYGGCPGERDRYGVPLEPDDPGSVDVLSICVVETDDDISELLSQDVFEKIQDEAEEALCDEERYAA